jgi:hypothetical protein
MAIRIEKGGWAFIFVLGLALVGYSLDKYGVVNLSGLLGKSADKSAGKTPVDTSKPLPVTGEKESNQVRVRVKYLGRLRGRPGR